MPRDWEQLKRWSARGALLRQSLAWLEENGEAGTFVKAQVLYWVEAPQLELLLTKPTDDASGSVLEGEREIDDNSLVAAIPSPDD